MNSEVDFQWPNKRKPSERKETAIKRKKTLGEQHVNHVGKSVAAKQIGADCKCTRLRCFKVLSREQIQKLFTHFYSLDSKELQDAYIAGCIQVDEVGRRRSRKFPEVKLNSGNDDDSSKDGVALPADSGPGNKYFHDVSFSYKVRVLQNNTAVEVPICRNAFLAIHDVTKGRLRTVQHALKVNQLSPIDMRGKHSNRPKAMPQPLRTLVEYQIGSFEVSQSRDSCVDDLETLYVPEDLSVKMMHQRFWLSIKYKSLIKVIGKYLTV